MPQVAPHSGVTVVDSDETNTGALVQPFIGLLSKDYSEHIARDLLPTIQRVTQDSSNLPRQIEVDAWHNSRTLSSSTVDIRDLNLWRRAVGSLNYPQVLIPLIRDLRIHRNHLSEALQDLREVQEEAREENLEIPSRVVISNAEIVIRRMYNILPRRFEVYPTDHGDVAIYVPGGYRRSVLVFCESGGSILCMVNSDGDHSRHRSNIAEIQRGGFIWRALIDLGSKDPIHIA